MTAAAQHLCNYAVLRFLPHRDTGEFVNVGIVAHCPELGWCAYAGDENDTRRVTQFFPSVTAAGYLTKRRAMFAEIARVCALVQNAPDRRTGTNVFQDLVKPRESLFRFSTTRSVLTEHPDTLVQQLCDQYVRSKITEAPSLAPA